MATNELEMQRFFNGLRIMMNIDRDEAVEAGILPKGRDAAWQDFRDNPWRYSMRMDDQRIEALWKLIMSRQPAWLSVADDDEGHF